MSLASVGIGPLFLNIKMLAVLLMMLVADNEPGDKYVCKLMLTDLFDLRVQVGAPQALDNHLFLRLICPNLMNINIYRTHHWICISSSLLLCSESLLDRH